jgi:hypothetical protein
VSMVVWNLSGFHFIFWDRKNMSKYSTDHFQNNFSRNFFKFATRRYFRR